MLSGQLYYYNAKVKEFGTHLASGNVSRLDILSVPKLENKDYEGVKPTEIARTVRDIFASNYKEILIDNELKFAVSFWESLTSPLKKISSKTEPQSDYQNDLIQWLENEMPSDGISHLLSSGVLATDDEDYACYYGLAVFNQLTLSQIDISDLDFLSSPSIASGPSNLSSEPQMLVFCSSYIAPLFANLNAEILPVSSNAEINLAKAKEVMQDNQEIKLVLLIGQHDFESMDLLNKKLPKDIIVSSLDLEAGADSSSSDATYFDKLVRDTLGVKLV